jgi:hypothetical protein
MLRGKLRPWQVAAAAMAAKAPRGARVPSRSASQAQAYATCAAAKLPEVNPRSRRRRAPTRLPPAPPKGLATAAGRARIPGAPNPPCSHAATRCFMRRWRGAAVSASFGTSSSASQERCGRQLFAGGFVPAACSLAVCLLAVRLPAAEPMALDTTRACALAASTLRVHRLAINVSFFYAPAGCCLGLRVAETPGWGVAEQTSPSG